MKNNDKSYKKSIITYTSGRGFQVKLRGKRQAKGLVSLYLDYYLGTKKDNAGKTKDIRQFEFLKLKIKDNPQNKDERTLNKEKMALAYKIRENRESELKHNSEGLISPNQRNINFLDYFQNFVNNYPNKDIRIVKYCFVHFEKFINKNIGKNYISPPEITEELLRQFKTYLEEKLNGETPHNYFTKLKKVIKQAYKDHILFENPAENIINRRNEGLKKDILSLNEIQILSKTYCGNSEVKRAFLLSCFTGLRYCDIEALYWKNISDDRIIIKSQQKTGKSVYIDLNNTSKNLLGKKGNADNFVFDLPSFTGCLKSLKTWTKKAKIEKNVTWHSARHSFAVNLLIHKTDIKTVSSLLGHAGLKHTEKYTRVIDVLKKQAVENLPEIDL